MEQERWVIRTENGVIKWGLANRRLNEPPHLFWNPRTGWMDTPMEARQYATEVGALRAVAWFHGRRWQRENVEVVRVQAGST